MRMLDWPDQKSSVNLHHGDPTDQKYLYSLIFIDIAYYFLLNSHRPPIK